MKDQAFYDAMQRLWKISGLLSYRKISERCPTNVSHTTIADVLTGKRVPRARTAEAIVTGLGGWWIDIEPIWQSAMDAEIREPERVVATFRLPVPCKQITTLMELLMEAYGEHLAMRQRGGLLVIVDDPESEPEDVSKS